MVVSAVMFAAVIGAGGYYYLGWSRADDPTILKSESATLSNGATLIDDVQASDGKAVLLPSAAEDTGTTVTDAVEALPKVASAVPVYMSSDKQPPPSNRWFSGLAFFHDHNIASFAHPLSLKTAPNGFVLSAARIVGTSNTVFGMFNPDLRVNFSEQTWNYVNYYDDMMVKADFKAGSQVKGTLTLTHGSPYAFLTLPNGGSVTISGDSLRKINNNYYGFTTAGTQYVVAWQSGSVNGTEGSNSLTLRATQSNGLVTIATIPNGATEDQVYQNAFNIVTGTRVEGARNGDSWNTTFTVSTENGQPTLFGFLPNESRGLIEAGSQIGTFDTLYGEMSVVRGNRFVSASDVVIPGTTYDAASFNDAQKAKLIPIVKADAAALTFDRDDTYFGGKAVAKAAALYELALQLGLDAEAQTVHGKLMAEFALWFDPNGCNVRDVKCFYYDTNLKSVVGKRASFGSEELNDHHFHYGYWMLASAIVAKHDPSFISTYGPYVDMLGQDYSNTDRTNNIAPYIRGHDLYLGHSWASGISPFVDGNNQESSSEGVNAHYGLYQWASVSGNESLASTALWMYARETAASTAYWTNIDKSIKGYDKFTAPFVSMVWGGKRDYATWFSAAGEAKLAIQVLPLTPASLYLGYDKERVLSNLQSAAPNPASFKDILIGYLALADPAAAQARLDVLADRDIDDGDTRSNLQAFIYYAQNQSAASKQQLQSAGECSVNVAGASSATYSVTLQESGVYRPWVRIAGESSNPAVAIRIDNGCPSVMASDTTEYTWVGTSNGQANTVSLSQGSHQVVVYGLIPGTKIDRVKISNDLVCTPSNSQGTCESSTPVEPQPEPAPAEPEPTNPETTPTEPEPAPTPAPEQPAVETSPSNLHVEGSTINSVTLVWDGAVDATYDVLRSGIKIDSVTGTTYTNDGLLPNTPYVYSVRGQGVTTPEITVFIDQSGQTSETKPTTTAEPTAPVGPSNLHAKSKTSSTITLAWNGEQSETYEVLRSGIKIATVTGTSFTDIGLLPNTPYIYSVRGQGVTTPEITVTIP